MTEWKAGECISWYITKQKLRNVQIIKDFLSLIFGLNSDLFVFDYFEWNAIQLLWVTRVNWIIAMELFINQWKWFTFSPGIKEMFSCFSGSVSNWLSPFLLLKLFSLNKANENMDSHLIGISTGKISSSLSKEVFFINVWENEIKGDEWVLVNSIHFFFIKSKENQWYKRLQLTNEIFHLPEIYSVNSCSTKSECTSV